MTSKIKHVKHIIQIFDNSYEYSKKLKSYEDRKEQFAWRDQVESYSGKIIQSELQIPKARYNEAKLQSSDTVVLIDYNADSVSEILHRFGFLNPFQIHCLKKASEGEKYRLLKTAQEEIDFVIYTNIKSSFKWKSFKFKLEETPKLYLDYDYFELGKPERDNFKIAELRKGEATEVNINGKKDATLTGRKARTYQETNVIFNYLGAAAVVKSKEDSSIKEVPRLRKRINLLKTLY